jgi:hypothetical protein
MRLAIRKKRNLVTANPKEPAQSFTILLPGRNVSTPRRGGQEAGHAKPRCLGARDASACGHSS